MFVFINSCCWFSMVVRVVWVICTDYSPNYLCEYTWVQKVFFFLGGGCVSFQQRWGRGGDLNPGKRLHRPLGYQATSPRPLFGNLRPFWWRFLRFCCWSFLVQCYHFRFLRNIKLSFWHTYSNPVSRYSLTSSGFSAMRTVNWSLAPASKRVCSMLM